MNLELKIPPPGYLLVLAALVWWLPDQLPVLNLLPDWMIYPGWFLIALAISLDLWSLALFLKAHTTPNPWQPDHSSHLVIKGLYHYTRNPMYVGLMVILTGWVLVQGNLAGFVTLPVFYVLLTRYQIIPEERILREKFGATYQDYVHKVPRWLW